MAPKNKKKNGFYFFMKEVKDKETRRGCNISMAQMPVYAHPIWKKMSLAEREPYEELARHYNKDPNLRGGKLASDGTRIEDNRWEEEEKIRQENKMKQDVKRYCNSDCTTEEQFADIAPKKLFYFMSFNLLCSTDDGRYIPIEVGIVEYSIQHGIHRQYCKIFYPGSAPNGYAGSAKARSEQTHQISVFGEDSTEQNMRVVYNEIKAFISPVGNEEYPPVFCERNDLPVTIGCLTWLSQIIGKENVFEVWDAAYLLMELTAGIGKPLPSYSVATDLLTKTSFNYHPSTRCEFHDEKDIHYCALAYSKKLCYLLSDAVCELFGIQLTEKHIPTRADEEKAYTVTIIKDTKASSDLTPVRLDKPHNYYQNTETVEENVQSPKLPPTPRQPASTCIAAEMNKLQLNITAATLPGHGIGRGLRRK